MNTVIGTDYASSPDTHVHAVVEMQRDPNAGGITMPGLAGIDPADLLEASRIEFQKEQLRAQFGIPPGYRLTAAATERYEKLMNAPGKAAARRLMQRWALEDKKTPFVTFERDVI